MAEHVFISYSHADRAYVEKLAAYLIAADIRVWYDYEIHTGDQFAPRIQEAIDECVAFVPVLTPDAARSRWVLREINHANTLGKPVLPLMLVACVPPVIVNDVLFEDVTGGSLPGPRFVNLLRVPQAGPPRLVPVWSAPEVRWALYGRRSWHRDGHEILYQYTGGLSNMDVQTQVRQLILGTPETAEEVGPQALPWVTIAPSTLPAAAPRLAVAVVEPSRERVPEATDRPGTAVRYVDFDLGWLGRAGVGYTELYRAVGPVELPLAPGQTCQPAAADLARLAEDIDALGFGWVLHTAALLLSQPVVIVPQKAMGVQQRLRCLDAVLALLPYGLRARVTVGTWLAQGGDHGADLAFGEPSAASGPRKPPATVQLGAPGQHTAELPPLSDGMAREYVTLLRRVHEALREDAQGGGTRQLVQLLWTDQAARHVDSPKSILEAVRTHLLPYSVGAEIEQARADARRRPEALRQAREVLAQQRLDAVPPQRRELVLEVIIDHGDVADLVHLDRYWSESIIDRVAATALRRPALWAVVAVAVAHQHDLGGFFLALARQAAADPVLAARASRLMASEEPPEAGDWPVLWEILLGNVTLGEQLARTLTQPDVPADAAAGWLRWLTGGALTGGVITRAPVWVRAAATAVIGTAGLWDVKTTGYLLRADPGTVAELLAAGLRHGRADLVLPVAVHALLQHVERAPVRDAVASYLSARDPSPATPVPARLRAMADVLAASIREEVSLPSAAFAPAERDEYGWWVAQLADTATAAQLVTAVLDAGRRDHRGQVGIDLATIVWEQTRTRPDGHRVTEAFARLVARHMELYQQVSEPTVAALRKASQEFRAVQSLRELSDAARRDVPPAELADLWCVAVCEDCPPEEVVAALALWPHRDQPGQVLLLLDQVMVTLAQSGVEPTRCRDHYLAANLAVVAGVLSDAIVADYKRLLAERAAFEKARWQDLATALGAETGRPAGEPLWRWLLGR